MKKLVAMLGILLAFLPKQIHAQITPKDFRLCLDELGCSDSTLKITKKQFLSAKQISPNFSWFHIKSLTVYLSGESFGGVNVIEIQGDQLRPLLQPSFKRISPRYNYCYHCAWCK